MPSYKNKLLWISSGIKKSFNVKEKLCNEGKKVLTTENITRYKKHTKKTISIFKCLFSPKNVNPILIRLLLLTMNMYISRIFIMTTDLVNAFGTCLSEKKSIVGYHGARLCFGKKNIHCISVSIIFVKKSFWHKVVYICFEFLLIKPST